MRPPLVVIAGGGTGGHIFPGLAVAAALRAAHPEIDLLWLGSRRGHEGRLVPPHGLPIRFVAAALLVGASPLARLWALLLVPVGVLQALFLFLRRRPRAVLGVGGYASFAGGVAARLLGLPLIICEQNALPGRTNRKLGRLARHVAIAFEEARAWFPAERVVMTGNPVRSSVLASGQRSRPDDELSVLIFGGSQGARFLNENVPSLLARLAASTPGALRVRHQTGPAEHAATQARYEALGLAAEVTPFIEDMGAAYAAADLVVCRAGATTIAELRAAGRAALLVPFPFAADDHQTANARALADAGAALVVQQGDWDEARVAAALADMLRGDGLAEMGSRAAAQARPEAAQSVAALLLSAAGLSGEEVKA